MTTVVNRISVAEDGVRLLAEKMPELRRGCDCTVCLDRPDGGWVKVSIMEAASYLRKLPSFRGVDRDYLVGWDARFQDDGQRFYHGRAPDDEFAVIAAACAWQRIGLPLGDAGTGET